MKLSPSKHITKTGVVKKNPPSTKEAYAVIGVDDENYTLKSERAEKFMKLLKAQGKLINSTYVGNQYFLRVKGEENLDIFADLLKQENPGRKILIRDRNDWVPDWVIEEEDDEENGYGKGIYGG